MNPGTKNSNYARDERSTGNLLKGPRGPKTRYVTAAQILDAIEDRFGESFADMQARIFKEYHDRCYEIDADSVDRKAFMNLFLHFSNKLTQNAPTQVEVADTTAQLTTEEIKERAKAIALTLTSS